MEAEKASLDYIHSLSNLKPKDWKIKIYEPVLPINAVIHLE